MFYYVYCLESEGDKEHYFGYTNDLKRRIVEHNSKLNFSTKNKKWYIIYYEACKDKDDAQRREKYLKTTQGRRMFKLRNKE